MGRVSSTVPRSSRVVFKMNQSFKTRSAQQIDHIPMFHDKRIAMEHRLHSSEKLASHTWSHTEQILDLFAVDVLSLNLVETITNLRNSIRPGIAGLHLRLMVNETVVQTEMYEG
jgi:hypothetical protein